MIRIVFENCDACMAANVGGSVARTISVFEFDCPAMEAHLVSWRRDYGHTNIVGIEVIEATLAAGKEKL